jgi:hypothetical protein
MLSLSFKTTSIRAWSQDGHRRGPTVEHLLATRLLWIEEQQRRLVPPLCLDRLATSESEARIDAREIVSALAEEEAERIEYHRSASAGNAISGDRALPAATLLQLAAGCSRPSTCSTTWMCTRCGYPRASSKWTLSQPNFARIVALPDTKFLADFLPKQADSASLNLILSHTPGSTMRFLVHVALLWTGCLQKVEGSSPFIRSRVRRACFPRDTARRGAGAGSQPGSTTLSPPFSRSARGGGPRLPTDGGTGR